MSSTLPPKAPAPSTITSISSPFPTVAVGRTNMTEYFPCCPLKDSQDEILFRRCLYKLQDEYGDKPNKTRDLIELLCSASSSECLTNKPSGNTCPPGLFATTTITASLPDATSNPFTSEGTGVPPKKTVAPTSGPTRKIAGQKRSRVTHRSAPSISKVVRLAHKLTGHQLYRR